jgi:hypothetical protein
MRHAHGFFLPHRIASHRIASHRIASRGAGARAHVPETNRQDRGDDDDDDDDDDDGNDDDDDGTMIDMGVVVVVGVGGRIQDLRSS